MKTNIRMTQTTMKVLELLLSNLRTGLSGSQIAKETHFLSGTLYPILHRLEDHGWLEVETENIDPQKERRPARKFYKLNGEARRVAQEELRKRDFVVGEPGLLRGAEVYDDVPC